MSRVAKLLTRLGLNVQFQRVRKRKKTNRLQPIAELLEERSVPATWVAQGPGPIVNGLVENIDPNGEDQVIGAVHTVLADSTDPGVLYIGATNGGIWKTVDATAARPSWTPLTDQQTSLSIGAMEFDPTDATGQTIVAGLGRYSDFGQFGGARDGILRSIDGGGNWSALDGGGALIGKNISGIAARGTNITVSVNFAESFTFDNVGIFRSTDGGASFSQISGGNGLSKGVSYDLAADPTNNAILYTSSVFSASASGAVGIYKSTDGGANWSKVSNAAMDSLIDNGTDNLTGTSNIEIAVGNSNNVYVAIINAGNLAGIFRSADGGSNWTQMDTPTTNENGTDFGVNPVGQKGPGPGSAPAALASGQGSLHFSIRAEPTNADLVYVGGDRQPGPPENVNLPNSIGATELTGRLFRGDASKASGSQWVHLTHSNSNGLSGGGTANSSAPHANSREMAFDANGNIIEVNDGGIYRRTNPQDNTGDWFSIIGDLQVTEIHNIAYDTNSDIIISGNQDTGTTFQKSTGNATWDSLNVGDGGDVAVDNVSLTNRSIRYGSSQFLQGFNRTTWDVANNKQSTTSIGLAVDSGDPLQTQKITPVILNNIDPKRLIIGGGNSPYESTNQGDNITQLTGTNASSENNLAGVNQTGPVDYGGRSGGTDNVDVLYIGSGNRVFVRTTAGAVLTERTAYTGSVVTDLVMDPDDWNRAFVIDSASRVFQTSNAGVTWIEITGDLSDPEIFDIEYIVGPTDETDRLVIGGRNGVHVEDINEPGNSWAEFGFGLPNAPVFDMDYDQADDMLVVGTVGRGAWIMENAANRPPTIAADNPSVSGDEGSQISNTGTYNDLNPGDSVTFSASIGTVSKTGTNSGTWTWTFDSNDGPDDSQDVTVTATDVGGESNIVVFSLTVDNVAPTIDLSASPDTAEVNTPYTLALGSITDPGDDTVTDFVVNWGDTNSDTFNQHPSFVVTASHTYTVVGPHTITVDLFDEDGVFIQAGKINIDVVEAGNKIPTVNAENASVSGIEGGAVTNTGSYRDLNTLDDVQLTASVGSVTKTGTNLGLWTWTYTPIDGDAGPTDVTITADDGNNGIGTTTFSLTVDNVAPTIELSGNPTVLRGETYTLTLGEITDPGDDTVTDFVVDWDDGSSDRPIPARAPNLNETIDHVFSAGGNYTISVDLVDEDGTHIAAGTLQVEVENTPPQAESDNVSVAVDEGGLAANSGTFTDPDGDAVTITASVGMITQDTGADGAWNWTFDAADGPDETQTVTITATDSNGKLSTTTFALNVNNIAPSITVNGASVAFQGAAYTLNLGAVTDPGNDTVTSFSIEWGDGDVTTMNQHPSAVGTVNHIYTSKGTRTITVDLTDEDGTYDNVATTQVEVLDPSPLTVTLDDGLSEVVPGQTISYTANIENTDNSNRVKDIIFKSALDPVLGIPINVMVTPIANDDSFAFIGENDTHSGNLRDNDDDPDGNQTDLQVGAVVQTGGPTPLLFNVLGDGSFTFNAGGVTGTFTYTYQLADADNLNSVKLGAVTISVSSGGPLQATFASAAVSPLWEIHLQSAVIAAKTRLADAGLGEQEQQELDRLSFSVTSRDGDAVAAIDANHVYVDRDGGGHGWFFDVTPLNDGEFEDQPGSNVLFAPSGSPASASLDLLTVVMRNMRQYLNPEIVDHSHTDLDPGVRNVETDVTTSALLSRLRRQHGFHDIGNYYTNYLGHAELWFKDRYGRFHLITPDGDIRRWDAVSFQSSDVVETVNPSVYEDPALLFYAPVELTVQEAQELVSLNESRATQPIANEWKNWGGLNEKWFTDGDSNSLFITPDGGIYSWNGRKDIASSQRIASVSRLAYDDPSLLFLAGVELDVQEQQDLVALQKSHKFKPATNEWKNWGGWREKWFKDGQGNSVFITPEGHIFLWNGESDLTGSVHLTDVNAQVYRYLNLLFEAREELPIDSLEAAVTLRSTHGFHAIPNEWLNWGGWREKWFADRFGHKFFITPEGHVYRWRGETLAASEKIAEIDPLVYEDLDLLFQSLLQARTTAPPAQPSGESPVARLTNAQLESLVAAAIQRWSDAGITDGQRSLLENAVFGVAELPSWHLGVVSSGRVLIDDNGAGRGWFVDSTPLMDEEFDIAHSATRLQSTTERDRIDALTTVMHEMGHLLSLEDLYALSSREKLMYGYLDAGERRLPEVNLPFGPQAGSTSSGPMLTAPKINELRAGKAVRVLFDAQVNNQVPANVNAVSVQGVVESFTSDGLQFPDQVSDDPQTIAGSDATEAQLNAAPDMALLIISRPPDVVLAGGRAVWDFRYRNIGNQFAEGVELTVRLSHALDLTSSSIADGWRDSGNGRYTIQLPSPSINAAQTIRLSFDVPNLSGRTIRLNGKIADTGSQELLLNNNNVEDSFETIDFDDRRWR